MSSVMEQRKTIINTLFPGGIPALWCPTLSHFSAAKTFDNIRIAKHLATIGDGVKGMLIPGSTGEGWEMSDEDIQTLLDIVLSTAQHHNIRVLIGILKTDLPSMLQGIKTTMSWLSERTGCNEPLAACAAAHVAGFTVCPPKGKDLTQTEILTALRSILDLGYPTALYQLPQITENEMQPETVHQLAEQYPHFFLLKDTSGKDNVARAGLSLGGVFLVRGAEGDYPLWTKKGGGPYDGFLLSTANVFAKELQQILNLIQAGNFEDAILLGSRIEAVVHKMFAAVAGFSTGNAFTNANKAMDHVRAYGDEALNVPAPLLYSGVVLPRPYLERAIALFMEYGFYCPQGYLNS